LYQEKNSHFISKFGFQMNSNWK